MNIFGSWFYLDGMLDFCLVERTFFGFHTLWIGLFGYVCDDALQIHIFLTIVYFGGQVFNFLWEGVGTYGLCIGSRGPIVLLSIWIAYHTGCL